MICVSLKMQTRAKAIITGGTMALLLLAASLVTTTFLMSPVIQQIWGETQHSQDLGWADDNGACGQNGQNWA